MAMKSCEQLQSELQGLVDLQQHKGLDLQDQIDAVVQQLQAQNCAVPTDLTGYWRADDGGFYYLRQEGETLWWVGLSNNPDPALNSDFGLQNGFTFSNVFRGQRIGNTIEGMWSDVPRGEILSHGILSLEITTADDGLTAQLQKTDFSGGFGGSLWSLEIPGWPSAADKSIHDVFDAVKKNQNAAKDHSLLDNLKNYKDHAVVFGTVVPDEFQLPGHLNYPSSAGFTYKDFICLDNNNSPPDGDLNIQFQIDRAQLDSQTNFWTDGWDTNPSDFQAKLDDSNNELHLEVIMFGRTAECGDDPSTFNNPPLLPGWQEANGNSVLLNGRPISGQVDVDFHPQFSGLNSILGATIAIGTSLRVTGVLVLDCGHGSTRPCDESDRTIHNQEIHPVYAIDIINPTPSDDLSGTWADDDGRTYYIHQLLGDNTIWGFGMSPFRDHTFARVFQGTMQQNQMIIGNWADVPLGQGQNTGTLTLQIEPGKMHLFADSSDSLVEQRWTKLYQPFPHTFPPPPSPIPSVSILGLTDISVTDVDLQGDPTVTSIYTIASISLQNPLTVVWSSGSPDVQFTSPNAPTTNITFDMTGHTVAPNRRIFPVDVSVTDANGINESNGVSVTVHVFFVK